MSGTVEVTTTLGRLRGSEEGGLAVFRGVPYAASTAAGGRFAAPGPVEPWTGVRDALTFGRACPQVWRGPDGSPNMFGELFGPGELGTDEDCLTLNVWTPGLEGARPVMVWVHGGAFRLGTGAAPMYDGASLAGRGDVVVVSLNYRLGPLGFLHEPALGPANAGLLDQVAALEWVRREIAAFGGDPDLVTVFGESAGGKSVECLMAMPAARGLFRRAIVQSTYDAAMDPGLAAAEAAALVEALGAGSPGGLRGVDVEELLAAHGRVMLEAQAKAAPGSLRGTAPVVDGDVLPAAALDAVAGGAAAGVDVMIGTTLDEFRLFAMAAGDVDAAGLAARLSAILPEGADPEAAAKTYETSLAERGAPAGPADVWLGAMTDRMFRAHSTRLAEACAAAGRPTFSYLFTWKAAAMGGALGACHAVELPFVFGTLDSQLARLAGEPAAMRPLSEAVQDAWVSFARTGVPSSEALPGWEPFDAGRRATMLLGAECELVDDPLPEERAVWAG